jgi:DNA helicase-2/ATP-dependent DNA helicase PcrA
LAFQEIDGVSVSIDEVIASAAVAGADLLRAWYEIVLHEKEIEPESRTFLSSTKKIFVDQNDFEGFIASAIKWSDVMFAKFGATKDDKFTSYEDEKELWNGLEKEIVDRIGRGDLTIHAFLQELDLAPKVLSIAPNTVRCLTIHSSKGMEFHHVYLVGVVEDQIPSFQSIKKGPDSKEMREERRNCFVAITRAQDSLTVTYGAEYFGWRKQPSRFIKEMELVP